jgi:hypothetical protein
MITRRINAQSAGVLRGSGLITTILDVFAEKSHTQYV